MGMLIRRSYVSKQSRISTYKPNYRVESNC